MRRKRRRDGDPLQAQYGWVDYGGERIWAVGFTEGGAPYGLTAEQYERAIDADKRERLPRPNWTDAKEALCEIARRVVRGEAQGDAAKELAVVGNVGAAKPVIGPGRRRLKMMP